MSDHIQFIIEHTFICDVCNKVFFAQHGNNEYHTFYYKDIKLAYNNHVKGGHEGLIWDSSINMHRASLGPAFEKRNTA